jgi:hypothetical protein
MKSALRHCVYRVADAAGYRISRRDRLPHDFDAATVATIEFVRPYTATSPERISALCEAVRYLGNNSIPGAIVECGVWRGGSVMAAARTLIEEGDTTRELYLFDTFSGLVAPGDYDLAPDGTPAASRFVNEARDDGSGSRWCEAPLGEVRAAVALTGYPPERIHFVVGRVEETVPERAPEQIALLRLDTDWYESTHHELLHLYPRVPLGGVLIVDDYGVWQGSRRAVDEYFGDRRPLLNRIDGSGRLAVVTE